MIVCRSTPPTLLYKLTSSANRQRPRRSMWGQIDGYDCAFSSIGASSKFSRITGSARQNGRSHGKGSTKFFRCFPGSVPLHVLTRSGKTVTVSLCSQSGAKRRSGQWLCADAANLARVEIPGRGVGEVFWAGTRPALHWANSCRVWVTQPVGQGNLPPMIEHS